jgi:hypothetical protein
VEVLTYDKSTTPTFNTLADAFNKEYGGLAVRVSRAFHDRFIAIDGADFFHFGSSNKDAGSRGFMFSKIEEPAVISLFKSEWLTLHVGQNRKGRTPKRGGRAGVQWAQLKCREVSWVERSCR